MNESEKFEKEKELRYYNYKKYFSVEDCEKVSKIIQDDYSLDIKAKHINNIVSKLIDLSTIYFNYKKEFKPDYETAFKNLQNDINNANFLNACLLYFCDSIGMTFIKSNDYGLINQFNFPLVEEDINKDRFPYKTFYTLVIVMKENDIKMIESE